MCAHEYAGTHVCKGERTCVHMDMAVREKPHVSYHRCCLPSF